MKKFKFLLATTAIAIVLTAIGYALTSGDKTPDAGLTVFNYILLSVVLMGCGLLIDLFLLFTGSRKSFISDRKVFWQVITGLVLVGIIYFIYVQTST